MSKKDLIKNMNDIYCRLGCSKIHGVGIFAIKEIPKDTNPFMTVSSKCGMDKVIKVHKDEIKNINPNVLKMVDDYVGPSENNFYYIPKDGLNSLSIRFYLNHSDKPNVKIVDDSDCKYMLFKTNKKR